MKEMRVWSLRVFSTLVLSSRNLKDWLSFGIRLMLRELGCLVGRLWSQTSFVGGGQTKHVAGWNMDHPTCFFSVSCVCLRIYLYMLTKCVCVYIYVCMHIFSLFIHPYTDIEWIFTWMDREPAFQLVFLWGFENPRFMMGWSMTPVAGGSKACPFFLYRNSYLKGFSGCPYKN